MIDEQINKLRSVGDAADQQLEELQLGKSVLASGEVIFGSLQSSLVVFGSTPKEALDYGVKVTGEFFTEGLGTRWMKSNIEAPYTFVSIMPGSKHRPLAAIHSSTNLSCGFSLHVAPHAGAWIETHFPGVLFQKSPVAPHAGAWIETQSSRVE